MTSVRGSLPCLHTSSIHDQTSSRAVAGHSPSHFGYGIAAEPRDARTRSSSRPAPFSGLMKSHRLPTSAETMPRPTQKSTQRMIVAGFSKKEAGPKSPPTTTSPKRRVASATAIHPSRTRRKGP